MDSALDELYGQVEGALESVLFIWPADPVATACELVFWHQAFPEEDLEMIVPLVQQWRAYRRLQRAEELRDMRRRGV